MGAGQASELSGFGFPESPAPVEVCDLGDCHRDHEPLVTDLYCHDHGRPLPLIGVPTGVSALVAIISLLLIYGSFELTAQSGSRTPVYVVYSALFLCFVAIPLRHFTQTAIIAALIWLAGSLTPVISRVTPGHFHVIAAAVLLSGAAVVFAGCAIAETSSMLRYGTLSADYRVIAWSVATLLVISAWSALASLLVRYSAHVLLGTESGLTTAMLVIALICVGLALLIVSVSGGVLGVGQVEPQVPKLPNPRRPDWVTPTTLSPGTRTYQGQNALDIMIETFTWVTHLAAIVVWNVLVVVGRTVANCVARAGYALGCGIVAVVNVVIRVAVLTVRWVRAAVATAGRLARYAVIAAYHGLVDSMVSVLVPANALFWTPWLVLAMAGQTRQHLRHGSVTALVFLVILLLAVSALLLGTWVILASQHPRESFRSAGRSIPYTAGYGLVALLLGGLLLGVPGEFGLGHIRLGLFTYFLAGFAVTAFALNRTSRHAPQAAYSPAPNPPRYTQRRWSTFVALAMITGTVICLVLFQPWTATSRWTVRYSNVATANFKGSPGLVKDTWTFTPRCAAGTCAIAVTGTLAGHPFSTTMRLSGRAYASTSAYSNFIYCGSTPMRAVLMLKIEASGAATTGGRWPGTSWTGSLELYAPSNNNCGASTITAAISAVAQ